MTGNAIREALEPFARAATGVGAIYRDEDCVSYTPHVSMILTVGDLRRARAAYDAIGAGSGVKALPWAKRPNGRDWFAATEVGQYVVGEIRDEYKAFLRRVTDDGQDQDIVVGKASTESEAKAAAQADFERRVLSCVSTHTAAGAGPVGEPVGFQLFLSQLSSWGSILYSKEQAERMLAQDTHVPAMRPVYARPVEEPGEVAHASAERSAAEVFAPLPGLVERLTRDLKTTQGLFIEANEKHVAAEAALAETRERLEKVKAAAHEAIEHLGDHDARAISRAIAMGLARNALRAALTGDAQEAGK